MEHDQALAGLLAAMTTFDAGDPRRIQHFVKAVSYTHLDVYKRQLLGRLLAPELPGQGGPVHHRGHPQGCLLYTSRCV